MQRLISKRELAELFGVSENTIANLVKRGILAPPVRVGRQHRWTPEQIRLFIEDRQRVEK